MSTRQAEILDPIAADPSRPGRPFRVSFLRRRVVVLSTSRMLGAGALVAAAVLVVGCGTSREAWRLPALGRRATQPSSDERQAVAQHRLDQGRRLAAEGRDEAAVEQLEHARSLAPDLTETAHLLAVAYDRLGRDDDAEREYLRALDEAPEDPALLCDYGYFLYSRDELARAEPLLRRACRAADRPRQAPLNLALVLAARGRTREAFDLFEQEVGTAAAHHNVGLLLARAGRTDEAVAHLRRASELDPAHAVAETTLARLGTDPRRHDPTAESRPIRQVVASGAEVRGRATIGDAAAPAGNPPAGNPPAGTAHRRRVP